MCDVNILKKCDKVNLNEMLMILMNWTTRFLKRKSNFRFQ